MPISNISFLYKVHEKVVTPSLSWVSQGLVVFCYRYFKLLMLHTYLFLIILKCICMLMIISLIHTPAQIIYYRSLMSLLKPLNYFAWGALKSSFTWSCQSSIHLVWHLRPTLKYQLFVFAACLFPDLSFSTSVHDHGILLDIYSTFTEHIHCNSLCCTWFYYLHQTQSFGVHFINMQ